MCTTAVFNMSKIQIWKRITTISKSSSLQRPLYLICQRYKFESESQPYSFSLQSYCAVFNMSKIQIWKRITTPLLGYQIQVVLYLICQRYKFESESQRSPLTSTWNRAVFNMSKIQIWKRITTCLLGYQIQVVLYLICQRYKFESESQRSPLTSTWNRAVFNMSKIQIWKRITTCDFIVYNPFELYLICQRYKFESESQLPGMNPISPKGCI